MDHRRGAFTARSWQPTGSLHDVHPQELLAQVLNALKERVGFDPADIEDVAIGNSSGTGDHGSVIGRMAVLAAGWPNTTPGFTVIASVVRVNKQ